MDAADHYRSQRLELCELYAGLSADQLGRPVPGCPLWTVRDLLGHLVGLPASVVGGDLADAGSPAWTQRQVLARRERSVGELVQEWSENGPPFEAGLPEKGFLGWVFTYDVTMHGDDVREALGLPLGASPTHELVLDGIAKQAGKRADGVGTLTVTAGDRVWTLGSGEPTALLTAPDEGELGRVLGGRRTDAAVRALAWEGDPEPWLPVLPLFREGR